MQSVTKVTGLLLIRAPAFPTLVSFLRYPRQSVENRTDGNRLIQVWLFFGYNHIRSQATTTSALWEYCFRGNNRDQYVKQITSVGVVCQLLLLFLTALVQTTLRLKYHSHHKRLSPMIVHDAFKPHWNVCKYIAEHSNSIVVLAPDTELLNAWVCLAKYYLNKDSNDLVIVPFCSNTKQYIYRHLQKENKQDLQTNFELSNTSSPLSVTIKQQGIIDFVYENKHHRQA